MQNISAQTYTKSGSSIYLKDFSERLLFDYQDEANEMPRDRRGGIRYTLISEEEETDEGGDNNLAQHSEEMKN